MLIETPPTWEPSPPASSGSDDWDRCVAELVRECAAPIPFVVGGAAESLMDAAIDAWPVSTGASLDALSLTYETDESTYTAIVDDPIDYARDIHDGDTVTSLIDEPAALAVERIVADLDRLIGKVVV